MDNFEPITIDVCKIPKIFIKLLFDRIAKVEKLDEKTEKIGKQTIVNYWKREFE